MSLFNNSLCPPCFLHWLTGVPRASLVNLLCANFHPQVCFPENPAYDKAYVVEMHIIFSRTVSPRRESRLILFVFWSCRAACGILVPRPGIEPAPPALEAQSLNHWTTKEVLKVGSLMSHLPGTRSFSVVLGKRSTACEDRDGGWGGGEEDGEREQSCEGPVLF